MRRRHEMLRVLSLMFLVSLPVPLVLSTTCLVAAAAAEDERSTLRREAWVAGQMQQIEKDPRIYLKYQAALTDELFRSRFRLYAERYEPHFADVLSELGRRTWSWAKSDEVDLLLQGASKLPTAGRVGIAIAATAKFLTDARDFGIKVEHLTTKWEKEAASKFVSRKREDLELILREIYNKSHDLATRSAKSSYTPDFLVAIRKISRDYSTTSPTASDSEIFNAAPHGTLSLMLYKSLARKTQAELDRIFGSSDAFREYVTTTLGDTKVMIGDVTGQLGLLSDRLAVLAKQAAQREAREKLLRQKAAVEAQYENAHATVSLVGNILRFSDPQAAYFVEEAGGSMLVIARSIESLSEDGFSASAAGNLIGAVFRLYSLYAGPRDDPKQLYLQEQFERLNAKLNEIIRGLRGLDDKVDRLIEMSGASTVAIREQLREITNELRLLQRYITESEQAKLHAELNTTNLICTDRLLSNLFTPNDIGSLNLYHECLSHMFAFGITDASIPQAVGDAAKDFSNKADLATVRDQLVAGSDPEVAAIQLLSLEAFARERWSIKIDTPPLRVFSSEFNERAVPGANMFAPRLWNAAIHHLIDYRLALPSYAPPANAPSASYLKHLAAMGEWAFQRVQLLTSDQLIRRAVNTYREIGLAISRETERTVRSHLEAKYPDHFYSDERLGPNLKGYLDFPVSFFVGFHSDRAWRRSGFEASRLRDLISLAGLFDMLDAKTTVARTVGGEFASEGERRCYRAEARLSLKGQIPLTLGTVRIMACGTISGPGFQAAFDNAHIQQSARGMAESYALLGFMTPHHRKDTKLPKNFWPSTAVAFDARTYATPTSPGGMSVKLDVEGESYEEATAQQLYDAVRNRAEQVVRDAMANHFANDQARSAFRQSVLAPLNLAYASLMTAVNARHGACGRVNPYLVDLRRQALSELDVEGLLNGTAAVDEGFWRRVSLTMHSPITRLSAAGSSSEAEIDLEEYVGVLRKSSDVALIGEGDLYALAQQEFRQPQDEQLYRYCYDTGFPSLVSGLNAILRWNILMDYAVGRTMAMSATEQNKMTTPPSPKPPSPKPQQITYRCRKGTEELYQATPCPTGYRQERLSR